MDLTTINDIKLKITFYNETNLKEYDLFYLSIDDCIEHYCEQFSISRKNFLDFCIVKLVVK